MLTSSGIVRRSRSPGAYYNERLDPKAWQPLARGGEDSLRQTLAALNAQGTTVVLIAHRPKLIAAVDRILALNEGATEMFGPRGEVLAKVTRRAAPMSPVSAAPLVAASGGA